MDKIASMTRVAVAAMALAFLPVSAFAQSAPAATPAAAVDAAMPAGDAAAAPKLKEKTIFTDKAFLYIAIAVSMACGCLAAGYAVGKVGSAVMGAAAERPEVLGKAIAYVGLGEGIALFGFLIALFLYTKV